MAEVFKCAHNGTKKVSELLLIQNPKNNNNHSKEQIDRLAKIIAFQGQRAPIVISKRSGFIVKGHGRLFAIDKLKWSEAAVDYQDYKTEAEEYADMTADNEIARWAEFNETKFLEDIKTIDVGDFELFGLKELPDLLEEKKEFNTDEDEIPEHVEPKSKVGDIYQLGDHRLMCGDSTDLTTVEKLMDGEKADMVFTDPPYGVNEETNRKDKKRFGQAESKNFSRVIGDESEDAAREAFHVAKAISETVIYWGANNYSFLPKSRGWIVWDKRENKGTDDNGDAELAWTNLNKPIRTFYHLWKGMIKGSEHGERRVHPTQKPIALAEWCFENYSNPKSVLDLFGGSGSTLIACEKTNRKCFMMELDPHYCDVIISRWENFTGKKAELING